MIVVDASVAVKWILTNEKYSQTASVILNNHIEKKDVIVIPSLLLMEVANTFVTKSNFTQVEIKESLQFLNDSDLKIHSFTKIDLTESAFLAKKYKTTFYDMLYAVVAKRNKCNLVTADENFIKKTDFKFVRHIKDF